MTPIESKAAKHRMLKNEPLPRPVRMITRSTRESISFLRGLIVVRLQQQGYTPRECFAVQLALEEALVNAVEHGNRRDDAKCLEITYFVSDFGTWIRIEDEGEGFNPDTLPDHADLEHLETPHGRGVALMRHFMTRVQYNHRGNAVTMELIRRRDGAL
jgi:serine/threonine-protein kinase RsbW